MTPPRSSLTHFTPHGSNALSPSSVGVAGTDHATYSKDNREGMYRRGVVRTLAVSAAIETLEKLAKITRIGQSLALTGATSFAGVSDAGADGSGATRAPLPKQAADATSTSSLPPSTIPQLSDLVKQWPEASCVVYGARAINSYMEGDASPRRLHTEDLDVQVFLGNDASPEQFFEFCRKLAVNMTWQLEGQTQQLRQKWAVQAKKVEKMLKGEGKKNGNGNGKGNGRGGNMGVIAPQNSNLSPSQRRELEIEFEVATDRGQSFGSFPWWRGQTTSFTMQTPSSVTYPGDDLPGPVVYASLPEGNFTQYRSVLQPHDVTHAKWAVLGPVVDFTWLKIAPNLNTVETRPLSALQPRVDRAVSLAEAVFNVPTRSLRWLDRANLLTLRGKSLENEWRRSKDAHRRQYMAELQRRGCLSVAARPEEEEARAYAADWAEFPDGATGSHRAQPPLPLPPKSAAELTKEELIEEVRALRAQLLL